MSVRQIMGQSERLEELCGGMVQPALLEQTTIGFKNTIQLSNEDSNIAVDPYVVGFPAVRNMISIVPAFRRLLAGKALALPPISSA